VVLQARCRSLANPALYAFQLLREDNEFLRILMESTPRSMLLGKSTHGRPYGRRSSPGVTAVAGIGGATGRRRTVSTTPPLPAAHVVTPCQPKSFLLQEACEQHGRSLDIKCAESGKTSKPQPLELSTSSSACAMGSEGTSYECLST